MVKQIHSWISCLVISMFVTSAGAQQGDAERRAKVEAALQEEAPKFLCLDAQFATAGQPKDTAYEKLAANGFKSVLNLRTAAEGVDLEQERALVEKVGLRYISIPVVGSAPKTEQVEEFLRTVKDSANHPMLIHCASANRAGAFFMIYRVLEQGWSEDKALEEAERVGVTSPVLKKFAYDYIASKKQGKS